MSTLNIKTSDGIKSYELKDSADTPRIAIRTSSGTKYLRLKEGSKIGELNVGVPIWVSDSRKATVTHYVSTLLDPDEVTPTAAPFVFAFNHLNDGTEHYGRAIDYMEEPSAPKYTYEELALPYSDNDHSNRSAAYSEPEWLVSDHEYAYIPSDNDKAGGNQYFYGETSSFPHRYHIFSHSGGGEAQVIKILIKSNGVISSEYPDVSRIIHKGDEIAIGFSTWGSHAGSNWSYWCRPMLRQLDVPSTTRKIPSNLDSYQAVRSAAIEAGGVVWNIDSGVMNFNSIYTSDGVKHTLRTLFANDWIFDNDYIDGVPLPVSQFGCTLLVCDALDNIYILPEGETSIKKYSWSKTTGYTLVNTYNK